MFCFYRKKRRKSGLNRLRPEKAARKKISRRGLPGG
jgi:hypothetical protein